MQFFDLFFILTWNADPCLVTGLTVLDLAWYGLGIDPDGLLRNPKFLLTISELLLFLFLMAAVVLLSVLELDLVASCSAIGEKQNLYTVL